MALVFYEETHQYFLDGQEVPSVSTLLSLLQKGEYANIPLDILEAAAERGKAVHRGTEDIDAGLQFDFCEDWLGYLNAYSKFKREHDVTWLKSEVALASPSERFAGTVDRIGSIDGGMAILDIKTTYKIHGKLVVPQLTFYKMLAEENDIAEIDKLYILQLTKNGSYTLKEFKQNKKLANALLLLNRYQEEK